MGPETVILNLFQDQGDEGENKRCVSLIAHLANPQAAVVSPARRVNQPQKSTPVLGAYFVYFGGFVRSCYFAPRLVNAVMIVRAAINMSSHIEQNFT